MKQGKKGLSLLLALVMLMSMTMAFTTTAFAADDIKITINPVSGTSMVGQTFDAYKVFDLTYSGAAYTYTVANEFKPFFAVSHPTIWLSGGLTNPQIASFLEINREDTDLLMEFTNLLFEFITDNGIAPKKSVTATSNTGATIPLTELGYYLVTGSAKVDGTYTTVIAACSLTTTDPSATVTPKIEFPTLKKEVNGGDETNASIGDKVNFKITTAIPGQLLGYTQYRFKLTDKLSDGLTFNDDVVVTADGTTITLADYELATNNNYGGTYIHIFFYDSKTLGLKGKEIVITYSATVNEEAVVGSLGNYNGASIEYTSNPYTGETGLTVTEKVPTYTYKIDVNKFTGTDTPLANAEFELRAGSPTGNALRFKGPVNVDGAGVYKLMLSSNPSTPATITTPGSGRITLEGLGAGTYYLTETKAPDGYNRLEQPIKVVITAGQDGNSTVTYDDVNEGLIEVQNNTGTPFPATGGIGRTIFTISGSILMAGALAALYFRRKVNE